ncbi:hypothetical protein [Campylobacter pinnipediorum]|uniref:hypothetical protein n=1 Tax=Campylobacter pinnipediorum TaxID=1965231 RepID=UPI00084DF132|nr:hypothetical protein [Campylobacter pinnipediorum]
MGLNAGLEEIIVAINTRKDIFDDIHADIIAKEIYPTSKFVANIQVLSHNRIKPYWQYTKVRHIKIVC